ncbi:MAG TPA: LemA family protein [Phycisphaerales bacterium]|nr:LemA family protein [Phycisphaerales bacterium]
MEGLVVVLVVVGAVVLLPLVWLIATYNRFVSLKQHLRESAAGIDVELKRRYDLIPNLVATVKAYAAHERDVLERVVAARARAMQAGGDPESVAREEPALRSAVGGLLAVAEAYPALKADAGFRQLQAELANTEDRIAAARRFYNGNVRDLNNLATMFPSSLVAGMAGVVVQPFYEVDSPSQRQAPGVHL